MPPHRSACSVCLTGTNPCRRCRKAAFSFSSASKVQISIGQCRSASELLGLATTMNLFGLFFQGGAIIFIDELDAIGTKRFGGEQSGDREVQRTMLELLNQLDGFSSNDKIKVKNTKIQILCRGCAGYLQNSRWYLSQQACMFWKIFADRKQVVWSCHGYGSQPGRVADSVRCQSHPRLFQPYHLFLCALTLFQIRTRGGSNGHVKEIKR